MSAPAWFVQTDGGRAAAGFRGATGDCIVRALALATGRPYREVYDLVADLNYRASKVGARRGEPRRTAREGLPRPVLGLLMMRLGFRWTATMGIGTGCRVHVRPEELPPTGRHVLNLSRHVAAWVDGKLLDSYDCSRGGTRCVYGYWTLEKK